VIPTGGSQGIGSGVVRAFLGRGYSVVATSRNITKSKDLPSSPTLALVDGDIGEAATAARVRETALGTFGSIDALVNNAGIFLIKPFTDYTAEDFGRLVSTNLEGAPNSRSNRCWCKNRVRASSVSRPRWRTIRSLA
jgi:NAD(P)-dependent dehydrogenase (short-subunit alcohol dehydrogenase family)